MRNNVPPIPRYVIVGISAILIAVILAGLLALFTWLHVSSHAFAASLQRSVGTTCVQAPTREHCNNQDPELQGCAADADTIGQANIVENGVTIGSVERRFSRACHVWWGRVIDTRIGVHNSMYITIAGTTLSSAPTFVSNQYSILYSAMVFDVTPTQQIPAITGSLLIDINAPALSATLPAITPPGIKE